MATTFHARSTQAESSVDGEHVRHGELPWCVLLGLGRMTGD